MATGSTNITDIKPTADMMEYINVILIAVSSYLSASSNVQRNASYILLREELKAHPDSAN